MTSDSANAFNNVSSISGSAPLGFSFINNGDLTVGGIRRRQEQQLAGNFNDVTTGNDHSDSSIVGAALLARR